MSKYKDELLNKNIFLNISKWGYAIENDEVEIHDNRKIIISKGIGGGEEFLLQTMEIMNKYGMKCYWLCFNDVNNREYKIFSILKYKFGTIIQIPNGFTESKLINWLKLLKPNIVHHQGFMREEIYKCCKKLRIEFLSGFHFWTGAILLDGIKKNMNILDNIKYHKCDPSLIKLYNEKYCNLYTVSPFVSECIKKITGYEIMNNIYASSSIKKCKFIDNVTNNLLYKGCEEMKGTFVTMINIHMLKGGDIFLYLISL